MSDKPKIKTAQELWREYRDACYPKGLTNAVQNRETHQAFISGMYAMFGQFPEIASLEDADAEAALQKLHSEIEQLIKARMDQLSAPGN